jgi:hypothetical protein
VLKIRHYAKPQTVMPYAKRRHKMKILTYILILIPALTFSQTDNKTLVDSILYVDKVPHCLDAVTEQLDTNGIFWKIVKMKDKAIPFLLDKIDDTTTTNAIVRHFGGYYTVGDLAYVTLQEIIHNIPTFELLGVPFDTNGCGYCAYWQHLSDFTNRQKFKIALKNWYDQNQLNLLWTEYKWKGEECFYRNPNNGYYDFRK